MEKPQGVSLQTVDVLILGAGAAGLFCAMECGKRNRRTLVLDHADRVGKKILISGGGRSNFTNLGCTPDNFLSRNPHFARSALARFTPADMVALVEKHRIPYHEKTLGQLFCDRSSRDLVAALERECAEVNARVQLETRLESLVRTAAGFTLTTSAGLIQTQSLVVATGGLSIPQMGATGLGYELARQFGLNIVEPRPALVPFTFSAADRARWCVLSGVSAEAVATLPAAARGSRKAPPPPAFREKVLITHKGLSGPAILQLSLYWQAGQPIALDLAPARQIFAPLLESRARRDPAAALTQLRTALPARWAERLLSLYPAPAQNTYSNAALAGMEAGLHAWTVTPAGTEGFPKAEVTAGGVDTAELDARTLQSRKVPGLFFIGEVVDVTGWLGGYNFQWAWASGFSAGQCA